MVVVVVGFPFCEDDALSELGLRSSLALLSRAGDSVAVLSVMSFVALSVRVLGFECGGPVGEAGEIEGMRSSKFEKIYIRMIVKETRKVFSFAQCDKERICGGDTACGLWFWIRSQSEDALKGIN